MRTVFFAALPGLFEISRLLLVYYVPALRMGDRLGLLPFSTLVFGLSFPALLKRGAVDIRFALFVAFASIIPWMFVIPSFRLVPFVVLQPLGYAVFAFVIGLGARQRLGLASSHMALLRVAALCGALYGLGNAGIYSDVGGGANGSGVSTTVLAGLLKAWWFLPLSLALAVEGQATKKSKPTERTKTSTRLTLFIAFGPPAVVYVFMFVEFMISFKGYCYGFTDGKWPCSYAQGISNHLFGIGGMFVGLLSVAWMATWLLLLGRKNAHE